MGEADLVTRLRGSLDRDPILGVLPIGERVKLEAADEIERLTEQRDAEVFHHRQTARDLVDAGEQLKRLRAENAKLITDNDAGCMANTQLNRTVERLRAALAPEALRRLVDDVWNAATDSAEVPHTQWADQLIEKWRAREALRPSSPK